MLNVWNQNYEAADGPITQTCFSFLYPFTNRNPQTTFSSFIGKTSFRTHIQNKNKNKKREREIHWKERYYITKMVT